MSDINIDIHATYGDVKKAFVETCRYGHLEVAQWLYSLGGINIHKFDDSDLNISNSIWINIDLKKWIQRVRKR